MDTQPDPETLDQLLEGLDLRPGVTDNPAGCVVIAFPRAISYLVLGPDDALRLATYLSERANDLLQALAEGPW